MYELEQVGSQTYFINCPAKIGVYAQSEREVYFIDSVDNSMLLWKVAE